MDHPELHRIHAYGLDVNARLFAEHVEIAYHALALALHAAQDAGDTAGLEAIGERATEQTRILSERASSEMGNELIRAAIASHARIFMSLAQQARATAIRLAVPRR